MSILDDKILLRNQLMKQIEELKSQRDNIAAKKNKPLTEVIVLPKSEITIKDMLSIINNSNWDRNQTTLTLYNGGMRLTRTISPKYGGKHTINKLSAEIYSLERKILNVSSEIIDIIERGL